MAALTQAAPQKAGTTADAPARYASSAAVERSAVIDCGTTELAQHIDWPE